jgi:hypothetical protein
VALGLPRDKASIDSKAGALVTTLRETLRECAAFSDLLSDTGIFANDAALTALGYSAGEVTALRAAFTDLKALYNVANNNGTVLSNNNFFFNAKQLTGVVV